MNYLFYDLEYASQVGGTSKICEFGYTITDENFNLIERNNFIINPNIEIWEWDKHALNEILTRDRNEYLISKTFNHFYGDIKNIFESSDYVFGHSLDGDSTALNDELIRYQYPSIDYNFFDIKIMYKNYSNSKKDVSLNNMLIQLNIEGEKREHDAEIDSYNTMLALKKMIENMNISLLDFIDLCPESKDKTENFKVISIENRRIEREEQLINQFNNYDSEKNKMYKFSKNWKTYIKFLDNVKPSVVGHELLKNKKICFSTNFEENNFKELLNIIQLIVNEGGEYIAKASESNIYVRYSFIEDEHSINKENRKYKHILEEINKGNHIDVIDFYELLKILNITEDDLRNNKYFELDDLRKKRITKPIEYKEKEPTNNVFQFLFQEKNIRINDYI